MSALGTEQDTRFGGQTAWSAAERLVDRSPSLDDLRSHRLHLVAERQWRQSGRPVPEDLALEELASHGRVALARNVLDRVRDAYEGQLVVIKGPEVATYYPSPNLRPFSDLDLIAEDARAAQTGLVRAGFVEFGFEAQYYDGLHHGRPLYHPELGGFSVEVHSRPNWPAWSNPPHASDILRDAVRARCHPELLAPAPAQHVILLVAHAWCELPLRRLLDLLDVALATSEIDPDALRQQALLWGLARVWNTTDAAVDALFSDGPVPLALRTWARNLPEVRDRTVRETHVRRLLGPFWALPVPLALVEATRTLVDTIRPALTETWPDKLERAQEAWRTQREPNAKHIERLGLESRHPPRLRRR